MLTPVTLAFYYTIELVIEELFNCAPGATSSSRAQHMDGVAARLETGIFGSVAGYLGVIEAQQRKMLHLHMLLQLHGFSHPDDIFRRGDLEARIKSAWRFVASICFRSSEAVAHHFHEDSAISALKGTSRVPLNPKQRGMIGPERVAEVMSKQLSARGVVLNSPDAAALVEPLRLPFPLGCRDPTLIRHSPVLTSHP
jgi:hypothetical protein